VNNSERESNRIASSPNRQIVLGLRGPRPDSAAILNSISVKSAIGSIDEATQEVTLAFDVQAAVDEVGVFF